GCAAAGCRPIRLEQRSRRESLQPRRIAGNAVSHGSPMKTFVFFFLVAAAAAAAQPVELDRTGENMSRVADPAASGGEATAVRDVTPIRKGSPDHRHRRTGRTAGQLRYSTSQ